MKIIKEKSCNSWKEGVDVVIVIEDIYVCIKN